MNWHVAFRTVALLLGQLTYAQTEQYIGIVQKISGNWELSAPGGSKPVPLALYQPVPLNAKVKIVASRGQATGYLNIALKDGQSVEVCCSATCRAQNNCGEQIAIDAKPRDKSGDSIFSLVITMLLKSPERFRRPAIGGRGAAEDLILADGVVAIGARGEVKLESLVQLQQPANNKTRYSVQAAPAEGDQRAQAKPLDVKWKGTRASVDSLRLTPGLHRISVLESEKGAARDTGINIWVLAVPAASHDAFSKRYGDAVLETQSFDTDVAGVFRRAYLSHLAREVTPTQ